MKNKKLATMAHYLEFKNKRLIEVLKAKKKKAK